MEKSLNAISEIRQNMSTDWSKMLDILHILDNIKEAMIKEIEKNKEPTKQLEERICLISVELNQQTALRQQA
jgi:hypothetical protein